MVPANPVPHDLCLPLVGCAGQVAGDVARTAATAVLGAVTAAIEQAGQWLINEAVGVAVGSITPELTSGGVATELTLMRSVVLMVALPVLCVATIGPVLRQDGRRLLRVWGIGLPVAIFGSLMVAEITQLALGATDELCAMFVSGGVATSGSGFDTLLSTKSYLAMPLVVQILISGVAAAGALLVWLELVVRTAAVYVAVLFTPLALVAFIWPATAGAARRAVEMLAALVLSKFVIVAALNLGFVILAQSGAAGLLPGCGVILLAAFAPFVLFRMTPVIEMAAVAHLEGLSRTPMRAARAGASTVSTASGSSVVQMAMSARAKSDGGPGGVGASPSLAPSVPPAIPDYFPSGTDV
jgi:hypothetical protein